MEKKPRKKPWPNQFDEELAELTDFAELAKEGHSDTDGSYTGNPLYGDEPVQDADDL